MATLLYHVGRLAFRWRWFVTLLWIAALAAVGVAAAKAPAAASDGFTMPGIESQKAFDLLEERFPGSAADGASARIVFVAPNGEKVTATENRAAIEKLVGEAADSSQVAGAVDPFQAKAVSKDATTAYATVSFKVPAADLTDASKKHLESAIDVARNSGLTIEVGGDALATQPSAGGSAEAIGIAIAALVLLITFGSLAAAGLPLLTAILGVGLSMASIMALSSTFGLSDTTGTLATMLGLACGIDYALFVVSRYREERAKGHDPREAAGMAAGTAGSAVVFAGLTVVIALAGLSVVGIPLLTKMGLAAAGAVLVSVLICLTLVPAVLGFWANAVLSRGVRRNSGRSRGKQQRTENGGSRWARIVVRHPLPVLLLGVAGLGVMATPVMDLQLGMPGDEAKATSTTERRAYDALAEGFGPGFNGPLSIVVDAEGADDAKSAVGADAEAKAAPAGGRSPSRPPASTRPGTPRCSPSPRPPRRPTRRPRTSSRPSATNARASRPRPPGRPSR
jgi:RND superfamily putative drug exporter